MPRPNPSAEAVLESLREAMKAKKSAINAPPRWEAAPGGDETAPLCSKLGEVDREVYETNLKWNVTPEYVITSHRKLTGKFIVFGKKIVRKLLRWYLNPFADRQRNFNGSVTRSLNLLSETAHLLQDELGWMRQEAAAQDRRVSSSEALLSRLNSEAEQQLQRLELLTAQLAAFRDELQGLSEDHGLKLDALHELGEEQGRKLADLQGLSDSQSELLSRLEYRVQAERAHLEELFEHNDRKLANLQGLSDSQSELLSRLENRVQAEREHLEELFEQNDRKLASLDHRLELLSAEGREQAALWERRLAQREDRFTGELAVAADRMRRIERRINRGLDTADLAPTLERLVNEDRQEHHDLDYFLFEQRYRGSREMIKERQKIYLDYFKGKENVLDAGCGRGEFVELLVENGIGVTGIDINEDMVNYCRERGLPVIREDLFVYLDGLEDGSLDGIFSAQLIEHLTPAELMRLVGLSRRKLKATGVLLFETINPENLTAMTSWFYMDLSHRKPVHPQTLRFILESEGFNQVKTTYLNPVEEGAVPHLDLGKEVDVAKLNRAIDRLNRSSPETC